MVVREICLVFDFFCWFKGVLLLVVVLIGSGEVVGDLLMFLLFLIEIWKLFL